MIRTILVPVIAKSADDASFAAALSVARKFAAHLDFLHVRRDLAIEMAGFGDISSPRLLANIQQVEADREIAAKRRVEQFCAREHVMIGTELQPALQTVSARWFCEVGDPADWVTRYGQTAELLVIARSQGDDSDTAALAEASLIYSGRPLYIPGPVPADPDTVAIAWKPTHEAARAIGAALPFLAAAKRVVVLTIEEGEPSDPDSTSRLVVTLQRHRLVVEARHAPPDGKSPQERLLMEATRLGAGLLVMGGYGHSRLREWVFGGFTEHILSAAPLPVLLSH
jgi:nucleotide-binding universal stress UspA family protein